MIIIEIQHYADGTTACITTTHATRAEAEQKYHTVLSFAAVSSVYIHSVVMLDNTEHESRVKRTRMRRCQNENMGKW